MTKICQVVREIEPRFTMEGAGVRLKRSFFPQESNSFDPFLLFDHFAFNDPIESAGVGFPMHPHRGIETVTYMVAGKVDHRDSLGNQGQIGPGDVQWMTAGGGIMHEEIPRIGSDRANNGFQLWVNLPASQKMTRPRYQGIKSSEIPVAKGTGWQAKVIAGMIGNIKGPVIGIAADPVYLDVQMEKSSEFQLPVNQAQTLLVYIFEGGGYLHDHYVPSVKMLGMSSGDIFEINTKENSVHFLVIAGIPFREPVAPYGPFVMNTFDEIQQALSDLRNGSFVKE
jgi:redox-sensitive bicupin YhaK (pirin superfamily)